jgi:hypothetical protein
MKENNFSNLMFENISQYKQAYRDLNTSQQYILEEPVFDDNVANNINNQISYVRFYLISLAKGEVELFKP